jgi:hypothetical protein
MTPATRRHWEDSCAKLAMVSTGIELGSYQPGDLFAQAAVHLMFLEGMHRLTAVISEADGTRIEWVSHAGRRWPN